MSDSNTFRILFDERDRTEIMEALTERQNRLQARITTLRKSQRATDASLKLDELEARHDDLKDLIGRVAEECA